MPSNEHTNIAVVESTWWQGRNTSVRGLFELVADINCQNPHRYHYEMANSEAALKEIIPRIGSYRNCKYLYLAMHGDENGLIMGDQRLSRTELRNLLKKIKATSGSTLTGIYLGSCLFGTEKLASFLFEEDVGVQWIAGYSTKVDWIKSSALDLLFFNELISHDGITEIERINQTASDLAQTAPHLMTQLGFSIHTRKRGGGMKNLAEDAYAQVDEFA